MTEQTKQRPTHRVSFARIIGTDERGKDKLGSPKEIGAIWERKDPTKGAILKFDHIPIELTKHQGVMFVLPVEEQ